MPVLCFGVSPPCPCAVTFGFILRQQARLICLPHVMWALEVRFLSLPTIWVYRSGALLIHCFCTVMQMSNWTGTIIGPPGTVHDGRIYTLRIQCGAFYPDQPPLVWLRSKVNLGCIDQRDGRVDSTKFPALGHWKREYTLETVLTELRRDMASPANRKLPQPPEGTLF